MNSEQYRYHYKPLNNLTIHNLTFSLFTIHYLLFTRTVIIHGSQNFFVDGEGIALAEVGHPLALQLVLEVGGDEAAHVGIVLRLLQHLSVDGVNGEILQFRNGCIFLENRGGSSCLKTYYQHLDLVCLLT